MPRCVENCAIRTGRMFLGHWRQWPSVFAFGKVAMTPLLAGQWWGAATGCSPDSVTSCFYNSAQAVSPVLHHASSIKGSYTPDELFFCKYIKVLPENEITATNHPPFACSSTKPTSLLLVQYTSCIWLHIGFPSPRGAVLSATFPFPP